MAAQLSIPIQPVENPILCSPYQEPDQHWLYDTSTGVPTRTPGRRPASYWFKSERSGSAQQQMSFLAEEERDDLPLVNALRDDVRRWRAGGWENASATTKTLLRHWWREDRGRRLFFCQVEAVETVIWLVEVAPKAELFARPRHPYTRMLLDAIPDIGMSGRARTPVQGEVPNPLEPPSSCSFHPRGPHANERCRSERPLPQMLGGIRIACHAVEEGRI